VQQLVEVVVGRGSVPATGPAAGALVDEDERVTLEQKLHGSHRGATRRCPIAGVDVDVHRPQAGRAVVRVAVTGDLVAALGAAEVLACAREAPRQKAPRRIEPNGGAQGRSSNGIASLGARSSGPGAVYLRTER
jgi:hypothetical protein